VVRGNGPDFLFTVKGGRFITHMKKLRDIETPLANFFGSGPIVSGIGAQADNRETPALVTACKIDNQHRDVFVYFDNDAKVHAPYDAIRLATRLAW
jgi:uncharacterized protein YecE (DUF72 family)